MHDYDFDETSQEGQTIEEIWKIVGKLRNTNLHPSAIIELEAQLVGHTMYLHKVRAECETELIQAENERKNQAERKFMFYRGQEYTNRESEAMARLDLQKEQEDELFALYRYKLVKGILENVKLLSISIAHRINDAKEEQKAANKS